MALPFQLISKISSWCSTPWSSAAHPDRHPRFSITSSPSSCSRASVIYAYLPGEKDGRGSCCANLEDFWRSSGGHADIIVFMQVFSRYIWTDPHRMGRGSYACCCFTGPSHGVRSHQARRELTMEDLRPSVAGTIGKRKIPHRYRSSHFLTLLLLLIPGNPGGDGGYGPNPSSAPEFPQTYQAQSFPVGWPYDHPGSHYWDSSRIRWNGHRVSPAV